MVTQLDKHWHTGRTMNGHDPFYALVVEVEREQKKYAALTVKPPEDPYDRLRREARARVHLAALGMYDDGPASPRVVKEARLANPSRVQLKWRGGSEP